MKLQDEVYHNLSCELISTQNIGIGTIMASMTPYSLIFGLAWIALLVVFMVFNIPLGPGGGIFYP